MKKQDKSKTNGMIVLFCQRIFENIFSWRNTVFFQLKKFLSYLIILSIKKIVVF